MSWFWLGFWITTSGYMYLLGQRAAIRKTQKQMRHLAVVLLKQDKDIKKLTKKQEKVTVEAFHTHLFSTHN